MLNRLVRPAVAAQHSAVAAAALPRRSACAPLLAARCIASSSHAAAAAAHAAAPAASSSEVVTAAEEARRNVIRAEQPWIFGEDPAVPPPRDPAVTIFGWGMAVSFVLMYIVAKHGPDTTLTTWAREEALHTGFQPPQPLPDLEDD